MNDIDRIHPGDTLHGEVLESDEAYLQAVYANSGTEEAITLYVDTHSSESNNDVEEHLARFCNVIAATALKDDDVDVDTVRAGFEIVTGSMNEVASRKYGYEPERGMRFLMVKAGVQAPQTRRYVRPLDDKYWAEQFMDQYKNGGMLMAPRRPDEDEQKYLARYTFACMRGLVLSHYQLAV